MDYCNKSKGVNPNHSTSTDDLRVKARYRWPSILTALGIPSDSLTNKHQPCPCCGGRDRFRFDDIEGNGSFICSHYGNGAGDGFHLVQHWLDCDFKHAAQAVSEVLGGHEVDLKPIQHKPPKPKDHFKSLLKIWHNSIPITDCDVVTDYLQRRGIKDGWQCEIDPSALRLHPHLDYWVTHNGQPEKIGSYHAMVARISNADDEMQGLHITYLENGKKLALKDHPAKKMRTRYTGALSGCAIRLFNARDKLAVCEGIETALAVRELTGLPVWACLSANGLKKLELPNVKNLYIYCDNDHHQQSLNAAKSLAKRATKEGINAFIAEPEAVGSDWLDELNKGGEHE